MKAEEWAQVVEGLAAKRGAHLRADRGLNPRGGPATLCPGGTNRIKGELSRRVLGCVVRRRRARGGRAVLEDGPAAGDPRQGPHARPREGRADLQRRVDRGRRAGRAAREPSQGRVRVDRLQQSLPGDRARRPRPDRAARAVQPRLPRLGGPDSHRGRVRDHRPPALLQLATGRPDGRGLRRGPRSPPSGCSRGCATRWRSRASTPICPAPGTRGWNRSRTPSREPGGVAFAVL